MIYFEEETDNFKSTAQRTRLMNPLVELHRRASNFQSTKLVRNMFGQSQTGEEEEYKQPHNAQENAESDRTKSVERKQKVKRFTDKSRMRTEAT